MWQQLKKPYHQLNDENGKRGSQASLAHYVAFQVDNVATIEEKLVNS